MWRFLFSLAWRDLRASGRRLWIFCACLVLGVSLVAAAGGLHGQVERALRSDARALLGGDVEVGSRRPLDNNVLAWMAARGVVSRVVDMRSMLRTVDGRAQLIALQSADAAYPLVGTVELAPPGPLAQALAQQDGTWGAAVDAVLAQRLNLQRGDVVEVGDVRLAVRATITRQSDRSLRADWAGAPVLVADGALAASELVQPLSRVDYRYRVRTDSAADTWRDAFAQAFPKLPVELRTFEDRSARLAKVLGQIGSGLMLIGFSALFIGGLGVFNSVQAYLQGKLPTLATLRALGLRDRRLAAMVLLQVLMLAVLASAVGVLLGGGLAMAGAVVMAQQSQALQQGAASVVNLSALLPPAAAAMGFGVVTALAFALPALGRALSVQPAVLFRGGDGQGLTTPLWAWAAAGALGAVVATGVVVALPDPRFGAAFVAATTVLLLLLEAVAALLRRGARALLARPGLRLGFEARLALGGLQRPDSPLRAALLSLGTALSLLVACTLVVVSLLRAVNDTVPRHAPGLVFYDVQNDQLDTLRQALAAGPGLVKLQTAPLVLGRIVGVNGQDLRDSADAATALDARDEQKLSTRDGNVDDVLLQQGQWWPARYAGAPQVAMEDREAEQRGLKVGDRLRFEIMGSTLDAQLVAIYGQRRTQARLWLEAIFSDGALDPFITRHVGAAYLKTGTDVAAQERVARALPAVASVRTASVLRETRALISRATGGLGVVAAVCLGASLLVLASVVAASRSRQVYEATVMHAMGARHASLRRVLVFEYTLLAAVTGGFAMMAGSVLATALLRWRLDIDPAGLYWTAAATALGVSVISLGAGARWLLAQMRLNPALLLRSGV